MNKRELLSLLDHLEVKPSRRMGQNFLVDDNLRRAILRDFEPRRGERVLEIGPGTGELTEGLLAAGCMVTAVEMDRRLCGWLRRKFADNPSLRLVQGDACNLDYVSLLGVQDYRCLANLPYAITTPWIMRMLRLKNPPRSMDLLIQKELAERLVAAPSTKQYGGLTAALSLLYQTELRRRVPPEVFYPPPEVASACVRLRYAPLLEKPDDIEGTNYVFALIRCSFSQRRKQLAKLLAPTFVESAAAAAEALSRIGVSPSARAEELSPHDFLDLAKEISTKNSS